MTYPFDVAQLFDDFSRMRVMVIGDVMVDAYLFGKVDRISPEAPVPVVSVQKRASRMGGAANVALNLHALGANPVLVSVIGNDAKGDEFIQLMQEKDLITSGIIRLDQRPTTTKFRIIGNNVQMLRVDEEITGYVDSDTAEKLLALVKNELETQKPDAIIFQDYDKGVLTPELINRIILLAKSKHIPVAVDPKKRNFLAYQGATLFKPNLKELREGLNLNFNQTSIASVQQAVHELFVQLSPEKALITLSENGVLMAAKNERQQIDFRHIPAHLRNISDVSGAGDTVISVAGLCLAARFPDELTAAISNLAGGLVCEEVGVVPIDQTKLRRELLVYSFSSFGDAK